MSASSPVRRLAFVAVLVARTTGHPALQPGVDADAALLPATAPPRAGTSGSRLANFTVRSDPVDIRYAESFMIAKTYPLPADVAARYARGTGRQMAIAGVVFDVVRVVDGTEVSAPLYEVYVHHAKVGMSRANGSDDELIFGTASDLRRTATVLEHPLRIRPAASSTHLSMEVHLINTQPAGTPWDGELSPLCECPLTPQKTLGTTGFGEDGWGCSRHLLSLSNPSCERETYVGGQYACMSDGDSSEGSEGERVMLVDSATCAQPGCAEHPRERFYFKATVLYEDETPDVTPIVTSDSAVHHARCCDPAGLHAEYDVLPCAPGTPAAACVHVMDNPHSGPSWSPGENAFMDLAFAKPHLHSGALSIALLDAANRTLCSMSRADGGLVYGTGREAGNERGYLVGMRVCSWDRASAPRLRRGESLRVRAVYDASHYRVGVMAQFALMAFV